MIVIYWTWDLLKLSHRQNHPGLHRGCWLLDHPSPLWVRDHNELIQDRGDCQANHLNGPLSTLGKIQERPLLYNFKNKFWFLSLPVILIQLNTIRLIKHPLSGYCLQRYVDRNTLPAPKKHSPSPAIHLFCELGKKMNTTTRLVVSKLCLQNLWILRRCSLTTEIGGGTMRGSRPSHPSFNSSSSTFICFIHLGCHRFLFEPRAPSLKVPLK